MILFVTAVATGCTASESGAGITADLILYNGKIVTVNQSFDIEEAIAIHGKDILAVGKDDTILALVGPNTRVINLKGKTVIPGLIDGHNHFMEMAIAFHMGRDVTAVESIEEMIKRIKKKVDQTPPGELVHATYDLQDQRKEKRVLTRYDLDPVSPNNPVIVVGGHAIYLNTYALQQAGITRETVSPEGGTIAVDPATGEPTGKLIENAIRLASKKWTIGAATHEQKLEAIRAGQKMLNAVGITSIREPGISAADMRVFQELRDNGELTVRVSMNYSLDPSKPAEQLIQQLETWGVSTGFGDSMLRLDGIGEFGIDGGFEGGLMSKPYVHAPENEDPKEYFGLQVIPTKS